ncbi:D-alanyl-D-alanine carboxypeptidase family protein [Methylomonas sp. AM2-LC]|uniref:D-alanyl-D-alanine carboxypeptidase family protein n=1 Tax=Methylomonas sp. AM2-LC TaxID=3153301 RepID=UPI003267ADAB
MIDADTGRVIHENEASQRWYPASLTKVMTIYMTFLALKAGELNLHDTLTVSKHASMQPNSRLGLRYGQTITVEQAIMAVTTRSANDAAVLLAETLAGGSEQNFAAKMTQQAKHLGMVSSSFQNASGLPDEGQISSARDLAVLSLAVIRDFPQYYPFFSATEFVYKGRVLPNTNKILKLYPDADGMKTGFTCGSGFNLIASARRNGHRVIGVLLGAHSSAERFAQMGDLLDIGFEKFNNVSTAQHVSELHALNDTPPPFQLSSNRCAGSAELMGAETGGRTEPIHVKPLDKYTETHKHNEPESEPTTLASNHWSVVLAVAGRKQDAEHTLDTARQSLGVLANAGQSQLVKTKFKGAPSWRPGWTNLTETDAHAFCKYLQSKNQSCTLVSGRSSHHKPSLPVHHTVHSKHILPSKHVKLNTQSKSVTQVTKHTPKHSKHLKQVHKEIS